MLYIADEEVKTYCRRCGATLVRGQDRKWNEID
jgi:hypothetical protein